MCGCFYGFPEYSNCSVPVNWRQYHIAPTGGAMGLTGVAKQDPPQYPRDLCAFCPADCGELAVYLMASPP